MAEATQYSTEHLHTNQPELVIRFDTTEMLHPGAHVERPDGVKGTIYAAIQPDRTADHSHGMSTIYVVRYEDGAVGTAGVERVADENGKNKFETRAGALLEPGEKYYYGRMGDAHTQPVSEETILGAAALMGVPGRQFGPAISRIHGSITVSPDGVGVTLRDGSLGHDKHNSNSLNGSLVHIGRQKSPHHRAEQPVQPPHHDQETHPQPASVESAAPETTSRSSEIQTLLETIDTYRGVLDAGISTLRQRADNQLAFAYELKNQLESSVNNQDQLLSTAAGLMDICHPEATERAIYEVTHVISQLIELAEAPLSNPQTGERDMQAATREAAGNLKVALRNYAESYDSINQYASFSSVSFGELHHYVSYSDHERIARIQQSLDEMVMRLTSEPGFVRDAQTLQARLTDFYSAVSQLSRLKND